MDFAEAADNISENTTECICMSEGVRVAPTDALHRMCELTIEELMAVPDATSFEACHRQAAIGERPCKVPPAGNLYTITLTCIHLQA